MGISLPVNQIGFDPAHNSSSSSSMFGYQWSDLRRGMKLSLQGCCLRGRQGELSRRVRPSFHAAMAAAAEACFYSGSFLWVQWSRIRLSGREMEVLKGQAL